MAGWSGEYSGHYSLSQIATQLHLVMIYLHVNLFYVIQLHTAALWTS